MHVFQITDYMEIDRTYSVGHPVALAAIAGILINFFRIHVIVSVRRKRV